MMIATGPEERDNVRGRREEFDDTAITSIADRLVREIGAKTLLDVWCSRPSLLEALRVRGVAAVGVEEFESAVAMRYLEREYDLILCTGVPGTLTDEQRRRLVATLCASGRDVIFAPKPGAAEGVGTTNWRSRWSELFAEHDFFLDVDFHADFVAPAAMRFRRTLNARVVEGSQRQELESARRELQDLRRRVEEKADLILSLNFRLVEIQSSVAWKVAQKLSRFFARLLLANSERLNIYWKLRRTLEVLVDEGLWSVLQRTAHKLSLFLKGRGLRVRVPVKDRLEELDGQYEAWLQLHPLTEARLNWMERAVGEFDYKPVISIVTPVYDTDPEFLRRAIESVRAQVYPHWELCIVNDGSKRAHVRTILEEYASADPRIRVDHLADNEGIAVASARAFAIATGEFVGLLDHDDELSPDALFEVAKRLNEDPSLDLIYSDEDKIEPSGRRSEPFFKPDWSPDLLLSMNYVAHFSVFRRSLLAECGGFRRGFDGSQDYDLLLRFTERTRKIANIPKILYHWRKVTGSAAASTDAKPYAYEAGRRALEEALQRRGEAGRVETVEPGRYRVRYQVRDGGLVSIIIPTRDHWQLLQQCIRSIEEKTSYSHYELIILDNDSSDPETLNCLGRIGQKWAVYRYPGPFNFSAINNFGAAKASGDYFLFLNNDIQVIRADWLDAMLEQAQRPEVGVVGAKLLYPDGRIQHAGVVIGIGGPAGHAFKYLPEDASRYHSLSDVVRNCSAVTGACLMSRRRVFDEVGGFDPRFKVAYNDVDLCLRLRQRGYLVIYTPFALLYHHESATRGRLDPPEEKALCWKLWGDVIKRGDPYYNPNLSRSREDWSLELGG